jgi:hypothetical protein
MKIHSFLPTKTIGDNILNREFFASVVVEETTGHFWWKKTKQTSRIIHRKECEIYWHWLDSGELTLGHHVENLERTYYAQKKFAGVPRETNFA